MNPYVNEEGGSYFVQTLGGGGIEIQLWINWQFFYFFFGGGVKKSTNQFVNSVKTIQSEEDMA